MNQDELIKFLEDNLKENNFNKIVDFLLHQVQLEVNKCTYRLVEIELYIYKEDHQDIYAHCHKQQKEMLTWYFHQMSSKEHSYKGGTFKGLDITCGNNDNRFGGILIRSVLNEQNNSVIEGPCKVVNEFLEKLKYNTIKDFVINKLNNNLSCFGNDCMEIKFKEYPKSEIYSGPRIGLYLKGDNIEEKKLYVDRKYRYIIMKDKIKKGKKSLGILKI
jgi:hypothetical protein